ncbi:MAG: hypothetical protein HQ481_21705 [Alphaproteobacteria bacterium]|nr:hypothetical protein [Alphaproteobacteria bacterium]
MRRLDDLADRFDRVWRRWRPGLLLLLKRLAILALVAGGVALLLWGARISCGLNPDCPWPILWEKNR